MNKEQPIKGWVKAKKAGYILNKHLGGQNMAFKPFDTVYRKQVLAAMEEYKNQFITPIQSGEERWISVEDRPLFTKDKENIWTLTEDGSKEFFAAVPYNDKNQPGKDLWWIRHCIIDDGGLKVVGDDDNEPAGWSLEDITYWRPFLKPPSLLSSEQKDQKI